jgi:hypothetical protein
MWTLVNTLEQLQTKLAQAPGRVLLKATAQGCKPCEKMDPLIAALVVRSLERPTLLAFDAHASPELSTYFDIRSMPTLLPLCRDPNAPSQFKVCPCMVGLSDGLRAWYETHVSALLDLGALDGECPGHAVML